MSRKAYILASSLLLSISGFTWAVECPEMREEFSDSRSSGDSLKSYTNKILNDEFPLNLVDQKQTILTLSNTYSWSQSLNSK